MKILDAILKLLSGAISLSERLFPAMMAYLYGKKRIEKKMTKANYEQLKKNADIASGPDHDNPADML